jgi:peptide/nickel transport system ATP-binding protein
MDRTEPVVLTGEIPDPTRIPGGCRFHPRCPRLQDGTADEAGVADDCRGTPLAVLPGTDVAEGRHVACHLDAVLHGGRAAALDM